MTFLWYDLETFGRDPRLDRIAQFAALRTDDRFQPLGDRVEWFCRVSDDYLPDPEACILTGIVPEDVAEKGLTEYAFGARVRSTLLHPGTCVVGYNNIRFDDEFVRNLLYRNFFDPYEREYADGNSRWDLIDVVRAAHDLRPDGLEWPVREDGRPSFRLEDLAKANGIAHEPAHDAKADVDATLELARRLQKAQPRLFGWLFRHRGKQSAARFLRLDKRRPMLHTSRMFFSAFGATSVIVPLAVHPRLPNCVLCYDLRHDPGPLLRLPVEEVRRRVFTQVSELGGDAERVHIKGVHLNRCPVLAPLSTLDGPSAERLGLDLDLVADRAARLADDDSLIQKVRAVYDGLEPNRPQDPESAIYSGGFFRDDDRAAFAELHKRAAEGLDETPPASADPRVAELYFRLLGRSFPEGRSDTFRRRWRSYCAGRLLLPPPGGTSIADFDKAVSSGLQSRDTDARAKVVLRKLADLSDRLKREVLSYTV